MVIQGVRPGTQAARLGLRQLDVFQSLDGKPVGTITALRVAMAEAQGKESVELVMRRYRRDAAGNVLYQHDEQGAPVTDSRGNPVPDYDLVHFRAVPGVLGVTLEPGRLPHPLDE